MATELALVFTVGVLFGFFFSTVMKLRSALYREKAKNAAAREEALSAVRRSLHDDLSSPLTRAYLLSFANLSQPEVSEEIRREVRTSLDYLHDVSQCDTTLLAEQVCLTDLIADATSWLRMRSFEVHVHEAGMDGQKILLHPDLAFSLQPVIAEVNLNVMKHADRAHPVRLCLHLTDTSLEISWHNALSNTSPVASTGLGLGIARDRLAPWRAELSAQEREDSFATTIRLPRDLLRS